MKQINLNSLLTSFKRDLEASQQLRKELDEKIAKWKSEYNGEPYGNERKGKSQIVSRDIKKQSEWQHATLLEPFVSTPEIIKANPVTYEDAPKARKCELILNTQFCRQFPRFNFMTKALKVLDQEGTLVVRTGWEYEEEEIEVEELEEIPNPQLQELYKIATLNQDNPQAIEQLVQQAQSLPQTVQIPKLVRRVKPIKNQPTAMVCRNEDVFIDPTCQDDMSKCQFVIHRYESDISTLKKEGSYKNLDKIWIDKKSEESSRGIYDADYETPDKTEFKFKDKARQKLLVYEYWGNFDIEGTGEVKPIVCTWIEDTVIKLEDNPFPDKELPFLVVPFNSVPFSLYGETNAEITSDVQKIKTAIYRGFIDNMALSNNGQKGIRKGALDLQNKKRYLNGQNFEYNGHPSDFYDGSYNQLPSSAFNILQLMNNEGESITGIKAFNQGMSGNSLGATATGIRGVLNSASTRRLNLVRNISENLVKPLLRKWLAYDNEFLDEEAEFRITNEEFVRLEKDDLDAKIDIELTISTSEENQAKAQELAFLLQTVGPNEDPAIRRKIMAKIAELHRMPDLAHDIKNYQPEPNPVQQRLQELELAKLEADVRNTEAKAVENEVDSAYKQARTQTELAKAGNVQSKTDMQDLDYLQKFHRTKEKEKANDDAIKRNHELAKEELKALQFKTV